MENKTKIIIAVVAVVVTIGGIFFGIVNSKRNKEKSKVLDEISNMSKIIDNVMEKDYNEIDNNIVENNHIQNNVEENLTNSVENIVNNTNKVENVIGKEEQESNKENTEMNDKQSAIELAKKEWGISVESYDFQASEVKSDGTYDVSVINRNDRNVITIYNVNVKTGVVTE